MSNLQAHALYDFEGQSGTGELTIRCGEVLTIIRKDVGEGWWEGTNSSGQSGLFPEAYVEVRAEIHQCISQSTRDDCRGWVSQKLS